MCCSWAPDILPDQFWATLGQKNLKRVTLKPGDDAAAERQDDMGKIVAFHQEGTT